MLRQINFIVFVSLLLSAIYFAAGFSHKQALNLSSLKSQGISADGWVQQGASLELGQLLPRGNRLEIQFSKTQPPGAASAQVLVSICGREAQIFSPNPGAQAILFLRGECEPRQISFQSNQVFTPGQGDNRKLIFQFASVKLGSSLGVPLLRGQEILLILSASLLLVSLLALLIRHPLWGAAQYLLIPICVLLVGMTWPVGLAKLYSLGGVLVGVLLGIFVACSEHLCRKDEHGPEVVARKSSVLGRALFSLALLAVAVVALAFRFYDLGFGLPETYHPDEVPKYNAIMRMRAHGDLNPRYFLHPSLLLYSTYFSNFVWQSLGLLSGSFESTLIFSGRIVSALTGSLSCVLLLLIGQRLFGLRVGFFAGLLLAVLPLHVTCSRYVKEDVLMTFWFLACVYTVVLGVMSRRGWLLLVAGACAGFAFATKYTGLLSIVALATCAWIPSRRLLPDTYLFRWTVRGLFCAGLAFLIASPYILLDLQTFLRDFGYEQRHMLRGHTTAVSAWSQLWVFHVGRSLIPGMSLPVFMLTLLGLGMLACRRDRLGFYVIGLALLYYLPAEWVKAKPEPQPERYVVPCLPFLALAAAYGMAQLKLPTKILSLALLALVFAPVTLRTAELAKEISPDTRERMSAWINKNIPAGSMIAYDWRPYNPMPSADRYHSYAIPRDNTIAELSFARLEEKGIDYLLLSSLFYGRYFKQPVEAPLREHFRKIFRSGRAVHQAVSLNGTYGFHNPAITIFAVSERAQQEFEGRMFSAPYVFEQGY